ncbi:MAG: c-type cytochrome, partial [Chloroflexi bacterium]|nr:c-type cytochrome [Chloroflexota bacterium]
TYTLNSHAAAEGNLSFATASDFIHLLAMSTWAGGLVWLIGCVRPALAAAPKPYRDSSLPRQISRFSNLALCSVIILGFTGVFNGLERVGDLSELIDSAYGQALLAKIVLFFLLLGLGAVNLLRNRPGVPQKPRMQVDLFRAVGLEILLIACVFGATALLTNLPPAKDESEALAATRPLVLEGKANDLQVSFSSFPGKIGLNQFEVRIRDKNGKPMDNAVAVTTRFNYLAQDLGRSTLALASVGDGRYVAKGSNLSLLGPWQVEVAIQRPDANDAFTAFRFEATATGVQKEFNPATAGQNQVPLWQIGSGLLLILAIGLMAVAQRFFRKQKRQRTWLTYGAIACALAAVAWGAEGYLVPGVQTTALASIQNPILPDGASIAKGKDLYTQNCAVCHGTTGHGNGPAAATMNPRPLDLTVHVSLHSDGELFTWISNGIPGTAMQGFAKQFTDAERWHILNFLHSLTEVSQ